MQTIEQMKADAKRLRSFFDSINIPLTHAQTLEAVAHQREFRDWNTAVAALKTEQTAHIAVVEEGITDAAGRKLTGVSVIRQKYAKSMVCVTATMSIDDVRLEIADCLRAGARSLVLRIDAAASGTQLRQARQIANETAVEGVIVEIDCPL